MAAVEQSPPESRIEAEVRDLRQLIERREFMSALAAANHLLAEVPENRDVLYMAAVSQRYLGRMREALGTLENLERLHPDFGRLFQERGHCYVALREPAAALEAFRRAVTLNGALLASWKALVVLYRSARRSEESAFAAEQVSRLERLPAPVLSASGMMIEGDILGAEQVLRGFLQRHGNHVEAMRLLAQIGVRLEVLDDAEYLLEAAVALEPDYHLARYDYANVLSKRHKHAAALAEARKLLQVEPLNRAFRTLYATACVGLGRHEEALGVYRELVSGAAGDAELHLSIAHSLKTLGRQSEAIEAYRAAAAARADFGDAYWSLANLKTYRFTDEELARMRAAEAAATTALVDRYHLCFALGKALEDRGEYQQSFRHYERGNSYKKSESRFDVAALERNLARQAALCTRQFLRIRAGWGCERRDPIFIVGLPRSGSTLLEQILASHSQIEGTMELADIPRIVQQLSGREHQREESRYPALLAELTAQECKRLGEKYLADTGVYRGAKPYFIDKMPNNFRHVGLIHLIVPNARIIDARREPMACCFSIFKQLFASGQEFSYSLEDIGRYYRAYLRIMAHWDEVLPGRILRVQHESVVADLEGNVRRIFEFLGLPFEAGCLEFYRTERSVRTASSEQVRQPIYKEGVDQWRHFEPWLGSLRAALGDLAPATGAPVAG